MRTYRQAALAATLGLAPLVADAAPSSMLQNMPRAEASQPESESTGRMGWLTKWFRDKPAEPGAIVTPPKAGVPAVMAYQPPTAPPTAPRGAAAPSIEAWGGFSPNAMVPTTPIASVAPTAAAKPPTYAPATTPLSAAKPAATTPLADTTADAKSLRRRGHELDRAGSLVEAERVYRQAIGMDPTSAAAVNDLGLCLARQGKLEPSAAVLRQAIMMRPDKPLYRNNIATVLVELDQADEALVHLKTAYGPATAHYNLGQLLARAGENGEAIEQLNEAVRLEPTLTLAQEALANLTAEQPPATAPADAITPPPVAAPAATYADLVAPTTTPAPIAATPVTRPTQIASAGPNYITPGAPIAPAPAAATGVPTFPRLLPPVLDR